MPELPDCVGDDCTVVVFNVTVTTQSYDHVDDASKAVVKETNLPQEMKDAFVAAVKARFPTTGKGCCEDDEEECQCACRSTGKVLKGPTLPTAPADISLALPEGSYKGFTVNGTYTYTMTVYEGICGPADPKEKKKKKTKPKKSTPKKKAKRRAG